MQLFLGHKSILTDEHFKASESRLFSYAIKMYF